jgi:hypothetical protein
MYADVSYTFALQYDAHLQSRSRNNLWKSLSLGVSKENDIFQIPKKPIRDERLDLSELENEFC